MSPPRENELACDDGKKWRSLAEHWPGYIITVDGDDRILSLNRSTRVMDAQSAVGRSLLDFVAADERAALVSMLREVRATGKGSERRASARLPDGVRHYSTQLIPLADRRGVVLVTSDVTAHVHAETLLQQSERRHRALVENSRDAFSLVATDGTTLYMSDGVERIVGWAAPEVVGQSTLLFVHPDDRDRVMRVHHGLLEDPSKNVTFEYRCLHRDGSVRWVEATVSNLLADSAVSAVVATFRDITERRGLTEQLVQSQKMEAVGLLAGGVAHEFNNLLNVILSYTELVMEELGTENRCADDLRQVVAAADRAAALTRQLLAFGRKQPRETRALSVNDVVVGMERLLRPLLGPSVSVATALDESIGRVQADPRQLEQVVMNLAVNARDAMPSVGQLGMRTRTERLDEAAARELGVSPGAYVVLSVSDTGCGMTPEVKARIFEPFFTTKGVGEGTGLGLSTVFGIVMQSAGGIAVDSTPGGGTTFHVYLPLVERTAPTQPPNRDAAPAEKGAETVLVVDDDSEVRRAIVRVLARAGYQVREASDGVSALKIWGSDGTGIDLVVADVVMPGLDGPSLATRLRRRRPGVPILFISGYPAHGAVKGPAIASSDHYLAKPFAPSALLAAVRRALDEPSGERVGLYMGGGGRAGDDG
jgi:two-component system, cell cycle sensor histidine kinase and response regulator CckA